MSVLSNGIAYAATAAQPSGFDQLLFKLNEKILNPLIELAFIVSFGMFLFGVMEFIRGADNEQKRADGKQHMLWGIIGLLIMFSVYGIISLLVSTFGIQGVTVNNKEQTFDAPPMQTLVLPQ